MNKTFILCGIVAMATLVGCQKKEKEETSKQPLAVKTMRVSPTACDGGIVFSGTVEEEAGSELSFAVGGTVKSINVSVGSTVAKGQLLAVVDDASLRSSYEIAATTLRQAADAYARMKQLHDAGSLPEIKWIEAQSQLEQAQAAEQIAKKNLTDTRLYAPFSGVVAEKRAEVGQNVAPSVPVLKLVKTRQVKVKIAVPETEISACRVGQRANVSVGALDGASFSGRISEKGVTANPATRSYEVKISIDNPTGALMPGMVCDVSLSHSGAAQPTHIVLPQELLQLDQNNATFVWVNRQGAAHKVVVQTGALTSQGVVITAGLREGDEVLTEGQQKVSEGTKLTVKP